MNLSILLLLGSAICFAIDTFWTPGPGWRVKLVSLGLLLAVSSALVTGTLRTP